MKNLKLEGLSVHIGSQITSIRPFKKVLSIINKIISKTNINFKFIDLGGGMGISYSQKERALDLNQYAKLVEKFLKNKKSKIIFEPGRFIAANTSILISKVIYIKKNKNKTFIILDAGMNDLMRPALYDTQHEIMPIRKSNKKMIGKIEFVGPICESTDKFLTQKNFSKLNEGDYIAITNVGAYGMSLASNYNARPIIAEILVSGSKYKIIKKRQSLENLINN
jgi:diaminopimelate decarboxylase